MLTVRMNDAQSFTQMPAINNANACDVTERAALLPGRICWIG